MNALSQLLKLALVPFLVTSLSAAKTHTVKQGDTLSSIARRNGTTASQLMALNGISDPNKLSIGQTLKVSASATMSRQKKSAQSNNQAARASSGHYQVQAGDTFYSIARRNGISVGQLQKSNPGVNPARLSVGQKLRTTQLPTPQTKKPTLTKTNPVNKAIVQPVKPTAPSTETRPPKSKPKSTIIPAPPAKVNKARAETPEVAIKATIPVIPTPQSLPEQQPEEKQQQKSASIPSLTNAAPATISTIMVHKEISFGALANKHRSSTKQLNELNGWSLKPTTVLAKGSEIYVPGS